MTAIIERTVEQKRVTISSKRQFTIPQKYYTELGFEKEAMCTMGEGFLIIQPISRVPSGEFAEEILSDLIQEEYTGQELLAEFKKRQSKVKPAVEAMLEAAKAVANGEGEYFTYDDVFGTED
ncbi:MAG: AbrB/MazE/SpoVT family DNA-binding domain-containing protein [Verrucomicrobia bacterium]|nr:AbrB/MazE/SpoVT family DNA-binding domain-containing protein [Verrucomicrobiota bacterium]